MSTQEHTSHTKTIWIVFFVLLIITTVEVALGIAKPLFLIETKLFSMHLLNWTFIILTVLKAYYIVWYFMHVKHETKAFRRALTIPLYILIPYLLFILLVEGYHTYTKM